MSISHHNYQFIFLTDNSFSAGKLLYRYISENIIDVYSTRVSDEFKGKGIAKELYQALILFAIENQLKIKPSCSYIEVMMNRNHPDLIA
ncbi:hypothetical protein EDC46_0322 [Vespertiliibacter pulmonis]|uniref:N-acetyltransferase domain-containing protein n=1 Tax=Vespertiliibacter pulmonis TaxID=1443036 RepID=A0A3N4WLB6_9PAST|nr:GNAT family N-acetyltransferase [Vespertiliibacter pulmonis]RPE85934.1 hypothetical protein EDC46_0322 [Vespertiliibacter pulmonis]